MSEHKEKRKGVNKLDLVIDLAIRSLREARTGISPENEYFTGILGIIICACLLTESKTNFEYINILVEKIDQLAEMLDAHHLVGYELFGFSMITLHGAYRLATDRYYLLKALYKVYILNEKLDGSVSETNNLAIEYTTADKNL